VLAISQGIQTSIDFTQQSQLLVNLTDIDLAPLPFVKSENIRKVQIFLYGSCPFLDLYVALASFAVYRKADYSQVREIAVDMTTDVNEEGAYMLRWQSSAIQALQEATEAFLVHLFEDAYDMLLLFIQHKNLIEIASQKFMCYSRETSDNYATRYSIS